MLTAMTSIEHLGEVSDPALALVMVRETRPSLVLLDTALAAGGVCGLVKQIKAFDHRTRCLVLADNAEQQQEALEAGADKAPLKGYLAEQLFAGVESLLRGER